MYTDNELKEEVNKRTIHAKDIERHTLKHKEDKDLKHLNIIDEGH